ncbi:MAG: hypothetical protein U0325_18885 [Polyangiales bacterium]
MHHSSRTRRAACAALLCVMGCGTAAPVNPPPDGATPVTAEGGVTPDAPLAAADVPTDTATPASDAGVAPTDGGTPSEVSVASPPPTTGAADIERWLATGAYRAWRCEAERHAARLVGGQREPHLHQRAHARHGAPESTLSGRPR